MQIYHNVSATKMCLMDSESLTWCKLYCTVYNILIKFDSFKFLHLVLVVDSQLKSGNAK